MVNSLSRFSKEDVLHGEPALVPRLIGALARDSGIVIRDVDPTLVDKVYNFARNVGIGNSKEHAWDMSSDPEDPRNAIYVARQSIDIRDLHALDGALWETREACAPGCRAAIQEAYQFFSTLTDHILEMISARYALRPAQECGIGKHRWLTVLRYPAHRSKGPESERQMVGSHIDTGITFTPAATKPGLERLLPTGTWEPVVLDGGELFLMAGEQVQQYTNGRIRALQHRVAMPPTEYGTEPRYAILFSSH